MMDLKIHSTVTVISFKCIVAHVQAYIESKKILIARARLYFFCCCCCIQIIINYSLWQVSHTHSFFFFHCVRIQKFRSISRLLCFYINLFIWSHKWISNTVHTALYFIVLCIIVVAAAAAAAAPNAIFYVVSFIIYCLRLQRGYCLRLSSLNFESMDCMSLSLSLRVCLYVFVCMLMMTYWPI